MVQRDLLSCLIYEGKCGTKSPRMINLAYISSVVLVEYFPLPCSCSIVNKDDTCFHGQVLL